MLDTLCYKATTENTLVSYNITRTLLHVKPGENAINCNFNSMF